MSIDDFNGTIDGGGYKFSMDDPDKPPMALVAPTFTEGVARVLGKGATKYAKGNWLRGMSFDEVLSAMERHLNALKRGEDYDFDSGQGHVFHIGCCAMFLAEFLHGPRSMEYSKFDDRVLARKKPLPVGQSLGQRTLLQPEGMDGDRADVEWYRVRDPMVPKAR